MIPLLPALVLAVVVAALLSWTTSLLLLPILRRHALAQPNARSSHRVPTPQGGGIGAMVGTLAAAGIAAAAAGAADRRLAGLALATLVLAALGLADDLRPLSARFRLLVQGVVAAGLLALLGEGAALPAWLPWPLATAIAWLGLVWWTNATNFMDGIDWITVAAFLPLTAALAIFGLAGALAPGPAIAAAALAGGLLGFAPWNRPGARLFLGDAGSLGVGIATGFLLLDLAGRGHVAAACLLPLYYAADATLTLARRALRGERLSEAHRSHFYQRAASGGWTVPAIDGHVFGLNVALAAFAGLTLAVPDPAVQAGALAAGAVLVGWTLRRFARGPGRAPGPGRPRSA